VRGATATPPEIRLRLADAPRRSPVALLLREGRELELYALGFWPGDDELLERWALAEFAAPEKALDRALETVAGHRSRDLPVPLLHAALEAAGRAR
jgi:hypothetical protein